MNTTPTPRRAAPPVVCPARPHEGTVLSVAFSPDGRFLATASADRTAEVRWFPSGEPATVIRHDESVHAVAVSAGGQHVATASADRTARVSALPDGHEICRLRHDATVFAVDFQPGRTPPRHGERRRAAGMGPRNWPRALARTAPRGGKGRLLQSFSRKRPLSHGRPQTSLLAATAVSATATAVSTTATAVSTAAAAAPPASSRRYSHQQKNECN